MALVSMHKTSFKKCSIQAAATLRLFLYIFGLIRKYAKDHWEYFKPFVQQPASLLSFCCFDDPIMLAIFKPSYLSEIYGMFMTMF